MITAGKAAEIMRKALQDRQESLKEAVAPILLTADEAIKRDASDGYNNTIIQVPWCPRFSVEEVIAMLTQILTDELGFSVTRLEDNPQTDEPRLRIKWEVQND